MVKFVSITKKLNNFSPNFSQNVSLMFYFWAINTKSDYIVIIINDCSTSNHEVDVSIQVKKSSLGRTNKQTKIINIITLGAEVYV